MGFESPMVTLGELPSLKFLCYGQVKAMPANKSRTKKIAFRNRVIFILIFVWALIVAINALSSGYRYWFDPGDRKTKNKSEAVFNRVVLPPSLQFQSKRYFTNGFWEWDYYPHWIYSYKLTADKMVVYKELEQAFIKACGPNTPEAPARVGGDEEEYTYLDTSCDEKVSIQYHLNDDKTATIRVSPD
jgi:hypothetical protein